jgi:hypothetical protein
VVSTEWQVNAHAIHPEAMPSRRPAPASHLSAWQIATAHSSSTVMDGIIVAGCRGFAEGHTGRIRAGEALHCKPCAAPARSAAPLRLGPFGRPSSPDESE